LVALCSFEGPGGRGLSSFSGGLGEGETPLPIPNRAVKPLSADGTWLARAWESRTPPVFTYGSPAGGPFSLTSGASPSPAKNVQRGTGKPVRPAPVLQRVLVQIDRGEWCDGDGPSTPAHAPADRRSRRSSIGPDRLRPGRPPSRRRSRPRATRTNGPGRARCALGA
jgi:hypothetical protein